MLTSRSRRSQQKILAIVVLGIFIFSITGTLFTASAQSTTVGVTLLPVPVSITVTPSNDSINVGDTLQYTATAFFAVGAPTDVTTNSLTNWSITGGGAATIGTSGLTQGLTTGVSAGSVVVNAEYGGVVGITNLTVGAAVVAPPTTPTRPSPSGSDSGTRGTTTPGIESGTTEPEPGTTDPGTTDPGTTIPGATEPGTTDPGTTDPGTRDPGTSSGSDSGTRDPATPAGEPLPVPPGVFVPDSTPTDTVELTPEQQEQVRETLEQLEELLYPGETAPVDGITRQEVLHKVLQDFKIRDVRKQLLDMAYNHPADALSIFANYSSYVAFTERYDAVIKGALIQSEIPRVFSYFIDEVFAQESARQNAPTLFSRNSGPVADFNNVVSSVGQIYPDVIIENTYAQDIFDGTMLGFVNGYYEEPNSPFKPEKIISRIETVKILLNATGLMKWQYYTELEASLGGPDGVKTQTSSFADVKPTTDYMWWYPRYLAKACEVEMFNCAKGSNFRPDEYITKYDYAEYTANLQRYLREHEVEKNLLADKDNDTLVNYFENDITLTKDADYDTDADELDDGNEVGTFFTNPFLKDTDQDNLSDSREVNDFKTDPNLDDTDSDTFNDGAEIDAGTDPLDAANFPVDKNNNGINDEWETTNSLQVKDGAQDTDEDGISDELEYQYGTDPKLADTDNDGFSDAEEILELRTNPLNDRDPGNLESIGVRITSFQEGQIVADAQPFVKGFAPQGSKVEVVLRNDIGHEKILGQTLTDDNRVFIFQVPQPLRDGKYAFLARALESEKKLVTESDPVHVRIDSQLNIIAPDPKKLADKEVTEEDLLRNLRIEIIDKKPVLKGQTELGSRVVATWKSIVASSALIADNNSGDFAIGSPTDLEFGNHEVFVNAVRRKDGALSRTVKVSFRVGAAFPGSVHGAADGGILGGFNAISGAAAAIPWWAWLIGGVVVVGGGTVAYKKMRKS